MPERLRIFVSSPGDVSAAREVAAQTIERLAKDYARFFAIEPYLWTNEPVTAAASFQDSLEPPSEFDVVLLILWSRLGTPLPEKTEVREYRGIDDRAPVTGTEWEYEDALRRARETRGPPDILVYRSREKAHVDSRNAATREEEIRQLAKLDEFWARHFANQGLFLGAYSNFDTLDEFATKLETHLRQLIRKRIDNRAKAAAEEAPLWRHDPFRGLEAYDFEHAPIYFGQDHAVGRAMLQLTANAAAGSAFLLVLGASGSGKSSLVRAGIIPKLFVPRRVTGAAFLRRVVFRPSDRGKNEDAFDAFARRIAASDKPGEGLPEILGPGQRLSDLAAHLRSGGAPAFPFATALGHLTEAARKTGAALGSEEAKLVVLVDQLEELFTDETVSPDQRRQFIELLAKLAASGLVWVIATMRNDFWRHADEAPELARLAEGTGALMLLPPTAAQIRQMIERPAEAAGVAFETLYEAAADSAQRTGLALNAAIAEEVAQEPGALPLLSYLLNQLYRRDVIERGGRTLTFATHEALGRLEGAIANKAEAVLEACPPDVRSALTQVLFELIQLGAEGDVDRAVARRVPLATFAPDTPQRRLVEAFLHPDARLLISDATRDGEPTVRVAHEALISRWPEARDFVQTSMDALKIRRRLEERLALWLSVGPDAAHQTRDRRAAPIRALLRGFARSPGLLVDIDLLDAQRLLREPAYRLERALAAYIERSIAEDRAVRTRAFRAMTAAAVLMGVLGLAAASLGGFAFANLQQALLTQSQFLANQAEDRARDGDMSAALGIILEALPRPGAGRPISPGAVSVLQEVLVADPAYLVMTGHRDFVNTAVFSRDGAHVATASRDGTVRLWDAATGVQIAQFEPQAGQPANSAAFSPDGRLLVVAGGDGSTRVVDIASGRTILTLPPATPAKAVNWAVFQPVDGSLIATASADGTAAIWDAKSGRLVHQLVDPARAGVEAINFSRDGAHVVTGSDDGVARVWNVLSGALEQTLKGHQDQVADAEFSPDGTQVVTASHDLTLRLWKLADGSSTVLSGHTDLVNSGQFSPDGRRVISASKDSTVRVWDVATGQEVTRYLGHADRVRDAVYSADGSWIVTASYDGTARIWRSVSGHEVGSIFRQSKDVRSAQFSHDDREVLTASADGHAIIWNVASGQPLYTFGVNGVPLNQASWSPDERYVVTSGHDGVAYVWEPAVASQPIRALRGHQNIVGSAVFSPDGRYILTASDDRTARVWDWRSNAPPLVLAGHTAEVSAAVFSPNGRLVATAGLDHVIRIWDAHTGTVIGVLRGHGDAVYALAFSPDGGRLVSGSVDHTARVWDVARAATIAVLIGHTDYVGAVAFSPDGREVATGSADKTIRIWDAKTGGLIAILEGHTHSVGWVAYATSGDRLVSASGDGTARMWDIRSAVGDAKRGSALTGQTLPDRIAWSEAALFERLSEDLRAQLGLKRRADPRTWREPAASCDVLAADPRDPRRQARGETLDRLIPLDPVQACPDAPASAETRARFAFQRGRIFEAKGDFRRARENYQAAIDGGYGMASLALGRLMANPNAGMFNPTGALQLMQNAWSTGIPAAAVTISELYRDGVPASGGRPGLASDPGKAKAWLERAVASGSPDGLALAAQADERAALQNPAQRTDKLTAAFAEFAEATRNAAASDWPDEMWIDWRYRRASLARLLARAGLADQLVRTLERLPTRVQPQ